jgi:hypothetical protein
MISQKQKAGLLILLAVVVFIILAIGIVSYLGKERTVETSHYLTSNPTIISKVEWGALPPKPELFEVHTPEFITLHHGGVKKDPAADQVQAIRNLQAWCLRDRPWGDIPYHYVIDMRGKIYEARPDIIKGDTNTEYDTSGHLLIEVSGNYEEQVPIQEQLDAIVEIMAYLCRKYDISPQRIASHKDYSAETVCPGKNLYVYIQDGSLKRRVTELLKSEGNYNPRWDQAN